ncbi:MAG: LytR/AlgR family response regulator transcription factor [Pseudomonadota bacterium]|jgi:two-component system response regulator AlgR|nr:response regulator transcription factor [Rubrivivax sp.]MCA3257262.1 response regulator transcription factor [Rubrivivax sp.]MCE2912004.1 LytTR family DNA-binding domain-containing protein [Rubrivivax sp.]MCZ8032618.1 LytTR family DNA-binding domain-containing protein [Rubrivivax sp.]
MNDAAALRVLIVDDEPLARLRLRSLVDSLADSSTAPGERATGAAGAAPAVVVGEAPDADAALAFARSEPCDVMLLDIRMPGRDGLRLAAALRTLAAPPAVVFVTAHAEHALRAFELDAVDYLTKPVRRERLAQALQRVRQRRGTGEAAAAAPGILVVAERGRVLQLPLAEVLYLRAGQKYVTLRTADRSYVLDESLSELEQRLGAGFVRVHRNAVVALRAIRALELRDLGDEEPAGEGWAVRVAPLDEWLAVSRRQVSAVRQALARAG